MSAPAFANQPAASTPSSSGWRGLFSSPNSNNQTAPEEGAPGWMKYAAKGLGVFGGVVAGAFGIWRCVTLSAICLVAGIWQVLAGFLVIVIEAPMCCFYLDFVHKFSDFVNQRPMWQKAVFYVILSLPSVILCASISTFLGTAMIFASGIVYGVMALGKKASRSEMSANAKDSGLVSNMEVPMPTQSVP